MTEQYKIAVIGAGPGGLSAAAHAAELGISHVLFENTDKVANTIQKYQKGKHVMATPDILPLRSPAPFEEGKRETILDAWDKALLDTKTNVQYNRGVKSITGSKGDFTIGLNDGSEAKAEYIIMGIGVQGNPRQLNIDGDNAPWVQYQLDDPDEYHNETIVVVGASDSAIENVIALSGHNKVYIINRKDEFARAKEGNLNLILKAIEDETVECFYSTNPGSIELTPDADKPGVFVLKTSSGEARVPVDRIIARLGAIPQRALVESFGIEFPNKDAMAIPALSSKYECNVEGMYVIGALGGYPLIKQAMNQGYEVVEYIEGNAIKPADHPLLEKKFDLLPFEEDVDELLDRMRTSIPIFADVNALLFRELMLDSDVHVVAKGDTIFKKNDYTNSFYTIFQGNVEIVITPELIINSTEGNFFGEMSLISGRRRSATIQGGDNCVVIETPRRVMNKLIASIASVKRVLDETFIVRTIQQRFAPSASIEELLPIAKAAQLNEFAADEVIFAEGDKADSLHLIRSGSVTVCKAFGDKEIPMSYVAANNYVGEMGLLGNNDRSATIKATVKTETVSIDSESFLSLLDKEEGLANSMRELVRMREQQNVALKSNEDAGNMLSFLMSQGLGEATDVLLIDEDLCVGCDNCEKACAETHGGTSRLNRKAGPTFANIHVPTSCRHCEDPHCMKDCPPDAIKRNPGGEVFIGDNCIGCGNCETNCPYGVIKLEYKQPRTSKFWPWMLFGSGHGAGEAGKSTGEGGAIKQAVKCDMCKDIKGGASCVRACPTGAALRLSPEGFVDLVSNG